MECPHYLLAEQLGQLLVDAGQLVATAESCTGGWLSKSMTDIPGSSAWFERGFVTYSNAAKCEMLGVKSETLERYGAVSGQVVTEMVRGAINNSRAHCSVAITGVAGPGGGNADKPVGTVYLAWRRSGQTILTRHCYFPGDREVIRSSAVEAALRGLIDAYRNGR